MPPVELVSEPLDDTCLLRFARLAEISGFAHAITTRPWNMAAHQGPDADRAVGRRRRLCEHLGLLFERLTAVEQVHAPYVVKVEEGDVGAGREGRATAHRFADGMICDLPDTPLIQFSADCAVVLAVDPGRRVFGTAHASWRSTIGGIAAELVRQLREKLGADPGRLLAAIAPCAGAGEYEVGEEVRRIALDRLPGAERFFPRAGGRLCFDLRAANIAQLEAAGVPPSQILVAAESTISDARFFSHRRDGPATGRFALVAGFRS